VIQISKRPLNPHALLPSLLSNYKTIGIGIDTFLMVKTIGIGLSVKSTIGLAQLIVVGYFVVLHIVSQNQQTY